MVRPQRWDEIAKQSGIVRDYRSRLRGQIVGQDWWTCCLPVPATSARPLASPATTLPRGCSKSAERVLSGAVATG